MALNIATAEDAFLEGATAWEVFIRDFEAEWFAPLTMTLLASAMLEGGPDAMAYLRASDPENFDNLMDKIIGV